MRVDLKVGGPTHTESQPGDTPARFLQNLDGQLLQRLLWHRQPTLQTVPLNPHFQGLKAWQRNGPDVVAAQLLPQHQELPLLRRHSISASYVPRLSLRCIGSVVGKHTGTTTYTYLG